MLTLPGRSRVFVARDPVDMRKGFDGLSALVCHVIEEDPQSGHLFFFVNRRRDRARILWWDSHGYWLMYRRLEQGRFQVFDQARGKKGGFWPPLQGVMDRSGDPDPFEALRSS